MDPSTAHPASDPAITLMASDLDGTLFTPQSEVSPRTVRALRGVASKGVEVVVATGRSHWSALGRLEPVDCIRWIICSNGATVYDVQAGAVVVQRPLLDDHVAAVVDGLKRVFPTVGFGWESPEGVFHSNQWAANRQRTGGAFNLGTRPTKELNVGSEQILKLMVAHDRLTEYEWLDAMSPHVPESLSTSTSGASFVEVTAPEANKGDALRLLCHDLGVDANATIAFGDHSNDAGMLDWVATGYAMANAAPRLIEVADAIAPANSDDGVAQVLERLFALARSSGD